MPNIKISELSAPIAVTDSDLIPGVQSGVTRRLTWGGLKSTLAGALGRSYLGLGTAAIANVTTSGTDTTAGRVLKVGDFGLGAADAPVSADLNTLVTTGLRSFTASTLNIPPAPATGGTVMVLGRTNTGGAGTQLAVTSNSNQTFTRSQAAGIWLPWVEVWTSGGANAITVDTGSFGYGAGSGGTVTQATSKSTAVTLNKPSGTVTMHNESLAAGASVQFQLINSKVSTLDTVMTAMSGGGSLTAYSLRAYVGTVGSIFFVLKNESAAPLAQAYQFNFTIIKGASA